MLEKAKVILDIKDNDKDALLNIYIEQAKLEIEAYIKSTFIDSMQSLCIQMAVEKYNKRFYEGTTSTSSNGLSTSFKDGYSKEVMQQLNQLKKKVRFF